MGVGVGNEKQRQDKTNFLAIENFNVSCLMNWFCLTVINLFLVVTSQFDKSNCFYELFIIN